MGSRGVYNPFRESTTESISLSKLDALDIITPNAVASNSEVNY